MCTVSFFPFANGNSILAMNRDEKRTRALAHEVTRQKTGELECTYPIDPQGGGTWIGVNEKGLAITLLNRTQDGLESNHRQYQSRGLIIPKLFGQSSFENVTQEFQAMDLKLYPAFALAVFDPAAEMIFVYDHGKTERKKWEPFFLSSSSYLSQEVLEFRLQKFKDLSSEIERDSERISLEKIKAFHLSQDPEHPDKSILMSRKDSRTVSLTTITFQGAKPELVYMPIKV